MGIVALIIGLRYGYFSGLANGCPEGSVIEKTDIDL